MESVERLFSPVRGSRTADTWTAGRLGILVSPDPTDPIAEWWMARARKLEGVIFADQAGQLGVARRARETAARPALTSQRLAEAMVTLFAETILDAIRDRAEAL